MNFLAGSLSDRNRCDNAAVLIVLFTFTELFNGDIMRVLLFVLSLFAGLNSMMGQDYPFEGMWKGLLSQNDRKIMYDVVLKIYYETDSTLFGTSKIVSREGKFAEFYVEGRHRGNEIVFTDVNLMKESGGSLSWPWCIKKYVAEVSPEGDKWVMKGEWLNDGGSIVNGAHREDISFCNPGKFSLTKVKGYTVSQDKEGERVRYFQGRLVEIQQTFEVSSDSLSLYLIDNNQVDNDTITVFYDKELLVKQHHLSHDSLEIKIGVDGSGDHLLIIYANNIGEVPPNTAALIFYENGVKQEIAIRSDPSRNAGIIFRKKRTAP